MNKDTSDTVQIPLSINGKHRNKYVVIVDACDADLADLRWCVKADSSTHYARRSLGGKFQSMHRVILERILGRQLEAVEYVDHINGKGYDNRRENLRLATQEQNHLNRRRAIVNKTGYKGVSWYAPTRQYRAQIQTNHKNKNLGYFDTPEDAYAAYCQAALERHGEFANFGESAP